MTLLEKLNLEPGAVASPFDRTVIIIKAIGADKPTGFARMNRFTTFAIALPETLTNAEFLAACEEWLSKN